MTIRFSALFDENYCEINSCINIRNLFEIYIKFREIRDVQADNGTMKKIFLTGSSRNYRNTFSKNGSIVSLQKNGTGNIRTDMESAGNRSVYLYYPGPARITNRYRKELRYEK